MATYSRYDFMTSGVVQDEVSGSYYPDPLSLNYLNFKMSKIPLKDTMTDSKIIKFWNEASLIYGAAVYDDIVLTLNGVAHKNLLKPNDEVYFPELRDIQSSFTKRND